MKTIESIQIWDNGQIKTASVLNAYANINLNSDANFLYYLYSINDNGEIDKSLASGSIYMNAEIYSTWDQDDVAWDFVANSLNLIITGDYTPPQIIEQPIENNPKSL